MYRSLKAWRSELLRKDCKYFRWRTGKNLSLEVQKELKSHLLSPRLEGLLDPSVLLV